MSSTLIESPAIIPEESALRVQPVDRTPFYLTSRGEPLFAWLHTPQKQRPLDHAVLICPPIGVEQLHSHRSLRHLADALANRGIPTLRFDWHGTGDSAGCDEDPNRWETWLANARDAYSFLRKQIGCKAVSIVGLRMGAMLATEALGELGCENLVLWAPIASGQTYVRQQKAIEKLAEPRPALVGAAPGDIEAGGFLLSEATAAEFSKKRLLDASFNCHRALLMGPYDKSLAEKMNSQPFPVYLASPPGFAEMLAEPHVSQIPTQAINVISNWLAKQIATTSTASLSINLSALGARETTLFPSTRVAPNAADSPTTPQLIREQILPISDQLPLFGILSEPWEPSKRALVNSLPTIVLLNSGSSYRVGPGRLGVHLARELTERGFRCLRIDARGLGDSPAALPADENNPYTATVFRDIELTLQELRSRFGAQRCVLLGLCSGAYAAFQSAAQLADPMLVESVLVNPLTFYWQDGMTLDIAEAVKGIQEHTYMARMLNRAKIWKFLTGRTQIGYGAALKILARRAAHAWNTTWSKSPVIEQALTVNTLGHPLQNDLPADLRRIARAKRKLTMFLADGEPGFTLMNHHASREVKQLRRSGIFQLTTIPEGDHTFSRRGPRSVLIRSISDHLLRRYSTQ